MKKYFIKFQDLSQPRIYLKSKKIYSLFLGIVFILTISCQNQKKISILNKHKVNINSHNKNILIKKTDFSIQLLFKHKILDIFVDISALVIYEQKENNRNQIDLKKSNFEVNIKSKILRTQLLSFVKKDQLYIINNKIGNKIIRFESQENFETYCENIKFLSISIEDLLKSLILIFSQEWLSTERKINLEKFNLNISYQMKKQKYHPRTIQIKSNKGTHLINVIKSQYSEISHNF